VQVGMGFESWLAIVRLVAILERITWIGSELET
jgi:hypothetical protein